MMTLRLCCRRDHATKDGFVAQFYKDVADFPVIQANAGQETDVRCDPLQSFGKHGIVCPILQFSE
jgi:hypothetical protein